MVTRDVDPTAPLGAKRGIQTQIEVREHASGSHSVLLVNTLDRPGLLTGECFVGGLAGWLAAGLASWLICGSSMPEEAPECVPRWAPRSSNSHGQPPLPHRHP